MSDKELRHKKESQAPMCIAESHAMEEQDLSGQYCSECNGALVIYREYNPTTGCYEERDVCRDCGMEIKTKESKDER